MDHEPLIVSASFADPYMLLIRGDASVSVDQCHGQSLELEPITKPDHIKVMYFV